MTFSRSGPSWLVRLVHCFLLALVPAMASAAGTLEVAASAPASSYRTNLVLLGTAGGRTSYGGTTLAGISSALVVDGDVYLVDFGQGWLRRYLQAGLGKMPGKPGLSSLRAAFITHLHADHVVDYPALFQFGTTDGLAARKTPVRVFGPGPRGSLVPVAGASRTNVPVIHPDDPTPGAVAMTAAIYKAFANDINDNIRDSQKPDPHTLVAVEDIQVPNGVVVDANRDVAPDMQPFPVYQDDKVKVTAILVSHAPVYPSFAFRLDTADGAVVFSGDTSPSGRGACALWQPDQRDRRAVGIPVSGASNVSVDPGFYVDTEIAFREHFCPSCWTTVQSGLVPNDHVDVIAGMQKVQAVDPAVA